MAKVLRRRLGLICVRWMAVDLRMRWVRAAMVRRDACSRRRLLVRGHVGDVEGRRVLEGERDRSTKVGETITVAQR